MYVYLAGRREGKTTLLLDWLFEDPDRRGILVSSEKDRERFMRLVVKRVELSGREYEHRRWVPHVRTWDVAMHYGHPYEWAIDDLDMLISRMLHCDVKLVTMTGTQITGREDARGPAREAGEESSPEPGPRRNDGSDVLRPYWRTTDSPDGGSII
jgi:hypothetical protein